jgi:serine/threonine protein kinase
VEVNARREQRRKDPKRKSINITDEALRIGKIPIEEIAINLAQRAYHQNPALISPRTREVMGISEAIAKHFREHGAPPKTTAFHYRAGKMLGRGAFGKVTLGMHKLCRKLVALKSINKEFMSDDRQKSKIMHEVSILLRLRHRSVVQLYETFETKRHMILSMELCAGGDLLNYVRKRKKLDEEEAKVIFKQIIQGLGYIHRKRILHRDIKLDNILLDGKGRVKIADFGVSKYVRANDVMHEQSGTPAYIAPEILREKGYRGFKADVWSAGVVFYAMLFGTVPFKASNMKELHKMIIKGKYSL